MRRQKRHEFRDRRQKSEIRRIGPKNPSDLCLLTFVLLFSLLLLLPSLAHAQVGTCEQAEATSFLDIGNVKASIYNNGPLFWNGNEVSYEVPKGDSINAIFTANFIVAGMIDGTVRSAASDYGPYEFWPGPIDEQGNPPADCSVFDEIWEINSDDFALLDNDGVVSANMLNWPWQLGAPVIDGDGNPDNYDIEAGDRPELLGDQTLWWIMNDRGNEHTLTHTPPIGLEVHGTSYAFNEAAPGGDITFYRYKIINKNTSPLTKAFVGMWVDVDVGNIGDDYVGSDSLLHLAYGYNGDLIDEGGYESRPPAVGFTYLLTPKADIDGIDNDHDGDIDEPDEPTGMHAMVTYFGRAGVQGDFQDGADLYNYLRARWLDGQPITEGESGRGYSQKVTRYMYSGLPPFFWSELKIYPDTDDFNPPSDNRYLSSAGPFSLQPGESTEILGAFVWAQAGNNLSSVLKLKRLTARLHAAPDSFVVSGYAKSPFTPPSPEPQFVLGFDQNFPNPFTGTTTFRYSLPKTMEVRLAIYDVLGREVEVLTQASQEAGIYSIDFDGTNLPPGTYIARIELDHLRFTKLIVRVR